MRERNPELKIHRELAEEPLFAQDSCGSVEGHAVASRERPEAKQEITSDEVESGRIPLLAAGDSYVMPNSQSIGKNPANVAGSEYQASPAGMTSGLSALVSPSAQSETGAAVKSVKPLTSGGNTRAAQSPDKARARSTDPRTSKAAAAKLVNLGPVRDAIINALYTFGPQTDEGIAAIFRKYAAFPRCSPSGLRSRRSELVAMRLVEDSGETGKTEMGNPAIIWRLK